MRLVQVLVPDGTRSAVLDELDAEGIDYAVFEETGRGEFEALVQFPVPENGVETVLDRLRAAGIREDAYTIVLAPETVVSMRLPALRAKYAGHRISRDELIARALDLAPASSTFFALILLSTTIATTGLLLDSAATIIGAMVVAPLMGPAISASVGAVLDDRSLASRGVSLQAIGLAVAILTGAVVGVVVRGTILVPPGLDLESIPQVAERTSPNFLSLFLALGSGIAGAISVVRDVGSALVGVAIAVALIPPAATSGLGIAWLDWTVAVAAAVLVLVNLLAINLSALLVLWIAGFRPEEADRTARARSSVRARVALLVAAIAALSLVLGLVTYASFKASTFESETNDELAQIFRTEYPERLDFVDVTVEYEPTDILLGNPAEVNVLVGRPATEPPPPDLAARLDRRLTNATGEDVVVRVGFVTEQRTGSVDVIDGATGSASRRRDPPAVSSPHPTVRLTGAVWYLFE
ncbi:TIGR00341 family protein [Halorientalis pallida]|uniref:TIGR00341 family protein n=1 Tax=Halorientalis pallida TaxID=2479928 RepID=A0A498L509_9EURY|nr:TIGR00341 family protein [Halorientalis pallida]RXK51342.1 TIGR00341 family protein [Halorientalis pallida]